jgi:hypothetical protein
VSERLSKKSILDPEILKNSETSSYGVSKSLYRDKLK